MLARDENRQIEPRDVAAASLVYAPGYPVQSIPMADDSARASFWKRMGLSISGITLVSGLLAIVFGVLGYIGAQQNEQLLTGAFDIAKIFAGAVVGSTGAAAIAGVNRES